MTFIFECDSYPGPGHRRQFGEQSALTITSPSNEIIEASTSGTSCNQKDRQEKKKAEYDTWSQARTMTPPNAETSTKDGFESELYLIEVFALYV